MAYEDDRELKLAIIRAVAAHQLVSDKVLKSFTLQWTKDLTIEGMTLTYKPFRAADLAKMPADPKPVKKVSDVQSKLLARYVQMKKKFMLNRWCAYHGHGCIPTDVHHQRGKVGFADDQEIPLLLDTRYWIAVCRQAHTWIEQHPTEAKAQGYSEDRLTKTH
jgi:hypothetical protein